MKDEILIVNDLHERETFYIHVHGRSPESSVYYFGTAGHYVILKKIRNLGIKLTPLHLVVDIINQCCRTTEMMQSNSHISCSYVNAISVQKAAQWLRLIQNLHSLQAHSSVQHQIFTCAKTDRRHGPRTVWLRHLP